MERQIGSDLNCLNSMDEHRLRLRFEYGLSTSRGENPVRRINKRLRNALYGSAAKERLDAAQGLLREQETLRDIVLVQQLRSEKAAKLNDDARSDEIDQTKRKYESELRTKRQRFEEISSKLPKAENPTSSKELLLPVSNCEIQLQQLKKKECEMDAQLARQTRDFMKWKQLALKSLIFLECPSIESNPTETKNQATRTSSPELEDTKSNFYIGLNRLHWYCVIIRVTKCFCKSVASINHIYAYCWGGIGKPKSE